MILTHAELASIERQAVQEYPRECCGVILHRAGERRLLPCRNDQDALHARDPQRYPRDARTAYHIADADRLQMVRLEDEGFTPAVIYHSHIDAGAYFSETDKRNALVSDEPAYPDAVYLVTSVMSGRLEDTAAFRWDPTRRDFVGVNMEDGSPMEAGRPAVPASKTSDAARSAS